MKNTNIYTTSLFYRCGLGNFLLWGLVLFPMLGFAQEASGEPTTFDRPYWRKTIEGLDYSSGPDASTARTEMRQREAEGDEAPGAAEEQEPGWDFSIPGLQLIGKILLILAAAAILFLLLRALLGLQWRPRNKRVEVSGSPEADLEKIEEDIESFDLDDYIRKALENGSYRLAIRFLYLAVLKELSAADLIRWKKDKTNRDYLREMKGKPQSEEFHRLTRAFEQIWYGDPSFTEKDYRELEPHFRRFIHSVSATSKAL